MILVLGFDQTEKQLLFILTGMSRHMHRRNGSVNNLGAALKQAVDDTVHHLFIAWNGVRGHNDRVARLNLYLFMPSSSHFRRPDPPRPVAP